MNTPKIAEKKVAAKPVRTKPEKPYPDFPLFPHDSGQWAKTVQRRTRYFGVWEDWRGALDKWLREKDELLAGREPVRDSSGLTLGELVTEFMAAKSEGVATGDLQPRTVADYSLICERVIDELGIDRPVASLGPQDFRRLRSAFAKTHGPVALYHDITKARVLFNWGRVNFDIPPKYGSSFDKPSRAVLRRARSNRAKRLFERAEITELLDKANRTMKAMIYLGINCAFGNDDCAKLTTDHLDLDAGWHRLPRHKTGIERGSPLWPETVAALKDVLANRPTPANPEWKDRVFLTLFGGSFEGSQKNNPISKEMSKLIKRLGIQKPGRNFYSLRHTFLTHAKRTKDLISVHYFTGHAADGDDMDAVYNEETFDDDLIAVSDFVRAWLLADRATAADDQPAASGEQPSGRLRLYQPETPGEPPVSRDTSGDGNRAG